MAINGRISMLANMQFVMKGDVVFKNTAAR